MQVYLEARLIKVGVEAFNKITISLFSFISSYKSITPPDFFIIACSLPARLDMPRRRQKSDKRWSIYPSLHDNVSLLLEEDDIHFDFHEVDDAEGCIKEYDTNIMGRFICRNHACDSSGWSSKKIAITIRMYPGAKYNARVYHQRCKNCNSLSEPRLNESYAERVAYRLKKWRGIQMDLPSYDSKKSKGPHNSRLCEGCKAGHCKEGFRE